MIARPDLFGSFGYEMSRFDTDGLGKHSENLTALDLSRFKDLQLFFFNLIAFDQHQLYRLRLALK